VQLGDAAAERAPTPAGGVAGPGELVFVAAGWLKTPRQTGRSVEVLTNQSGQPTQSGILEQVLVGFVSQELQIHNNHLVWMLNMDAKAKLLQNTTLGLDDLVLQVDVVGI